MTTFLCLFTMYQYYAYYFPMLNDDGDGCISSLCNALWLFRFILIPFKEGFTSYSFRPLIFAFLHINLMRIRDVMHCSTLNCIVLTHNDINKIQMNNITPTGLLYIQVYLNNIHTNTPCAHIVIMISFWKDTEHRNKQTCSGSKLVLFFPKVLNTTPAGLGW